MQDPELSVTEMDEFLGFNLDPTMPCETSPEMSSQVPKTTASNFNGDSAFGARPRLQNALSAIRLFAVVLILALLTTFITVVPVGHRGILLTLGVVQTSILDEGFHLVIPIIQSVRIVSVRIQPHLQDSEAATKDLQDVSIDLVVLWHIPQESTQKTYQSLGDSGAIESAILDPTVEDALKSVVAGLTAEELITERQLFQERLEHLLAERLSEFNLELDGINVVQLDFSSRFRAAVEAKQVAEQDARRAAFEAVRARRQAAARVYVAEGEAKAQELLQSGLTPKVLQRQAIEKWDGHVPLVVGNEQLPFLDFKALLKEDRDRLRR